MILEREPLADELLLISEIKTCEIAVAKEKVEAKALLNEVVFVRTKPFDIIEGPDITSDGTRDGFSPQNGPQTPRNLAPSVQQNTIDERELTNCKESLIPRIERTEDSVSQAPRDKNTQQNRSNMKSQTTCNHIEYQKSKRVANPTHLCDTWRACKGKTSSQKKRNHVNS